MLCRNMGVKNSDGDVEGNGDVEGKLLSVLVLSVLVISVQYLFWYFLFIC